MNDDRLKVRIMVDRDRGSVEPPESTVIQPGEDLGLARPVYLVFSCTRLASRAA